MSTEMRVAIVMGSDSDEAVMRGASEALDELGIRWEMRVLSAHRTPDDTVAFARAAAGTRAAKAVAPSRFPRLDSALSARRRKFASGIARACARRR